MKLKHLLYIAFVGMSLAACSSDDNIVNDISANKAKVNINLTRSEIDATLDSRATSEMPINSANLMYNLILLHYNSNQVLVEVSTDTNADLSNGLFEETWTPTLTAGDDDYIVLLANVKQDGDVLGTLQGWSDLGADRFANLRDAMTLNLPLTSGSDGLYDSSKSMYMLGYYKGTIASGTSLNVMMGRMASCLKLVITPSSAVTIASVQIKNAASNTHYFPASSTADVTYINYVDNVGVALSAGSSQTLYYYTGENINPTSAQYTTAVITATTAGVTTYTYSYSQNSSEEGKTLTDVTTKGTQSMTADPYYNPRYYGPNIKSTTGSGWYQHRYYYKYYKSNGGYLGDGYCYANTQPTDQYLTNTIANNGTTLRYFVFTSADNTTLSNYYPYYFSSSTSVGGVTYDAGGYKHRFYVATTTGGTSKTYTVKLGSDSPTKANRNYSLYRNNTYTFNINLQ